MGSDQGQDTVDMSDCFDEHVMTQATVFNETGATFTDAVESKGLGMLTKCKESKRPR